MLTLVFDLDGTLVDTAPDLAASMNEVLRLNGRPAVPPEVVRHMVGRGARKLIERGFEHTGEPVAETALDRHFDQFLEYYEANIAVGSRPFPGAHEEIVRLHGEGHRLGVCTNKPERLSVLLLEQLGLAPYFGAILGADSLPFRKPDPRHLLETIDRLGGARENAIMIGDSEVDAETARAAGVRLIILTCGYTALDPRSFGADALLDGYDELPDAIRRLAAGMAAT